MRELAIWASLRSHSRVGEDTCWALNRCFFPNSRPRHLLLSATAFWAVRCYFGHGAWEYLRENFCPKLHRIPTPLEWRNSPLSTWFQSSPETAVPPATFRLLEAGKACFFAYDIYPTSLQGILFLLTFSQSFVRVLHHFWKSTATTLSSGGVARDKHFSRRSEARCDSSPVIAYESLAASRRLACARDLTRVAATLGSSSLARWSSSRRQHMAI